MTQQEYISRIEDGTYLEKGTEMTACMRQFAREAQRITAEIQHDLRFDDPALREELYPGVLSRQPDPGNR